MNQRILALALCAMLFAVCLSVDAQQPKKVPRIGFLQRRTAPGPANPDPLADAFFQGLRDLGYVDGKNIKVEHRY
ncbi:MAG TPA: hypothetical protein VGA09_01690, partial [Candidatus Binatia bacterium]